MNLVARTLYSSSQQNIKFLGHANHEQNDDKRTTKLTKANYFDGCPVIHRSLDAKRDVLSYLYIVPELCE